MRKLHRLWEQYFKIWGIISSIKDLFIIFGVSGGMTTVASISQFFMEIPWGYRIPLLLCVFALLFVWVRHIILERKRIVIRNKSTIIDAIAEFELRARKLFLQQGYLGDYEKALDSMRKQMLIAGLTGLNPVSELVNFASSQFMVRPEYGSTPIFLVTKPSEVTPSLWAKATKARQWIEIISKQEPRS